MLLLGGCFSYQPLESVAPPPVGEQVQIELTGAGQDNLLERRALVTSSLSGRLLEDAPDEVLLQVQLSPRLLGYGTETVIDTIRVPRADIREVGVRTLSKERTIAAAAVSVAAVAGAFALFTARQSSSGSNGGGTDVFAVVPLSAALRLLGIAR